jgi:phage shock protein A
MWERFKRLIRSIVGFFISSAEDPELILQQNIRDMNDQVPKMNQNIALIKANVTLLEKELNRLNKEETELLSKVKASIKAEREDLATNFATTLESVRSSRIDTEGQLKVAKAAFEKALEVKKVFIQEKEKKTKEALQAIQASQRAKWQGKVADAMEQFEIAGIDQTHDEMIRKINEEAALNEAKLEMALTNVDIESIKIEEEAEKIRANELVQQIKKEMETKG